MLFKILTLLYSYKNIILLLGSLSCVSTVVYKYSNILTKKIHQKKRMSALKEAIEVHNIESRYLEETGKIVALDEKSKALEELLQQLEGQNEIVEK